MEKRVFERVSANLPAEYYWDGVIHKGTVNNLSRNGMYIQADICPAGGSHIEVVLGAGDDAFNISCTVKRTEHINGSGGMGIELKSPYANYRKFVSIVQHYMYDRPH